MKTATETHNPPPISARIWAIAAITGAGAFMAMLDSTIVNLAVDAIRIDFQADLNLIQWTVSAYLIALAVSLPAASWLCDRFGHGRAWMGSTALFVLGSALCALASGPLALITARIIQGLAGGILIPSGQALIGVVAGSRQLGRLFGVIGLVVALGPAIGPAIGGLLLESAGWRSLFWINVPIGATALIAAYKLVPKGDLDNSRSLDVTGLILLGTGLSLLLLGSAQIGVAGISIPSLAVVIAGTVFSVAFVFVSRHRSNPLLDLALFKRRTFSAAAAVNILTGANMYGGLFLLPLYFQISQGTTATETGLLLFIMGLGSAISLFFAGRITDRYGAALAINIGALLLVLSLLPFVFRDKLSPLIVLIALIGRGAGLAFAQMPAMTAAYSSVASEKMSGTATLINVVQRLGASIGAIGASLLLMQFGLDDKGFRWAFGALMILSILMLIYAAKFPRQSNAAG
ncbi:DHA2 family efflux MFS transporter permease subunit [Hyphococcus sp.]|uniref:DHA2 family efflux MFS transporter permease subunit n=1 Tax=Hyphococcus sp. TaxID=2038636 RepID=UPI002087992B|nr:MAG: MFS transporter [Marinicaulis sp.]